MFCIIPKKVKISRYEVLEDGHGNAILDGLGNKLCARTDREYWCFLWFKFKV